MSTLENEALVTIGRTCCVCGKPAQVTVTAESYARYRAGAFVQDVWPTMPAAQREMIITGTHGPCFDQLFDEDPGKEDDDAN